MTKLDVFEQQARCWKIGFSLSKAKAIYPKQHKRL